MNKQTQIENFKKAKSLNLEVMNWYLNMIDTTPADMAVFFDMLLHGVSMFASNGNDELACSGLSVDLELVESITIYRLKELRDLFHKTAIDNGQSLTDSDRLEFYFGNAEAYNPKNS